MITKGISTSPTVKKSNPKVVAIPMTNFVGMLTKRDANSVGEIRVLPSPSTIKTLEQLRSTAKTNSANWFRAVVEGPT